ncbi:hypothetical protein GE21DRAFT_1307161 [Neurospora crassa]|nr:hypothetical protein GE21DRAFT_1307161 [Neurospora crassa]
MEGVCLVPAGTAAEAGRTSSTLADTARGTSSFVGCFLQSTPETPSTGPGGNWYHGAHSGDAVTRTRDAMGGDQG